MRTLTLLVLLGLPMTAFAQPDFRPVILTGADLPALVGASLESPACYAYTGGSWVQCPLQIDERAYIDPGSAYPPEKTVVYGGVPTLLYTRPRSYGAPNMAPHVPFDPDVTFDTDDELVLMARYFGEQAPPGSVPPGTQYPLSEIVFENTYAYLFASPVPLDQSAGIRLVTYTFQLANGSFPQNYQFNDAAWTKDPFPDGEATGANPEISSVSTGYYQTAFSERWFQRELRTSDGLGGFGPDLLDRVKYASRPDMMGDFVGSCSRSEYTATAGSGTLGIQKNGPLRGIRFVQGFNSGPLTSGTYFFYEQMMGYQLDHRVHPTKGSTMFFDYSPAAAGMQYYSNHFPNGVPIDGLDEKPEGQYYTASYLDWDYLLGNQGSLVSRWQALSNLEGITPYSYYEDDTSPEAVQCTGEDLAAYASTGNMAIRYGLPDGGLPPLDPRDERIQDSIAVTGGEFPYVSLRRQVVHRAPGMTALQAQTVVDQLNSLGAFSVRRIDGEVTFDALPPYFIGQPNGQTFEGTARDDRAGDTGVAYLYISHVSSNLRLQPGSFNPGDPLAPFTVTLLNPALDGTGFITAVDGVGNRDSVFVSLTGTGNQQDVLPPLLSGKAKKARFEGTALDNRALDTGVGVIWLDPTSVNLALDPVTFVPGDPSADFFVRVVNRNSAGEGRVWAQDITGNVSSLLITLNAGAGNKRETATVYPNPANPSTTLRFEVLEAGMAQLEVFNVLGQRVMDVRTAPLEAGIHHMVLDGTQLSSGVYYYRLTLPDAVLSGLYNLLK